MQLNINSNQSTMQQTKEWFARDGVALALHTWVPTTPKALLFYVNGIQSHAAWFAPIAEELASHDIATFVLDRRGTGESEGLRGDIPSADILLNDYHEVLRQVRERYPTLSLTLFGQSMGGSILSALLSRDDFNIPFNAIVFSASALGKRRQNLSQEACNEIRQLEGLHYVDIGLRDEDYADNPQDLTFMQNDSLYFKQMTERTQASLLTLEDRYFDKEAITGHATACYLYPRVDPIVNIEAAITLFMQLTDSKGLTLQLPVDKHYLWFTKCREQLTHWLKGFVLSAGYRK